MKTVILLKSFSAGLILALIVFRSSVVIAAPILVSQGLDASAYTSSSDLNASYAAVKAFDGDTVNTKWIANGTPVQWIEVDLGQPYDLGYIELTAEGNKTSVNHEIWASSSPIGSDTTGAALINTRTGGQTDGEMFTNSLAETANRRYVQVRTTALVPDGYAGWRELEVYVVPESGILISQGLGASAYTSSSDLSASYTAVKAFDGDTTGNTRWIASAVPIQWIEVDLGQPYNLDYINLTAEGNKTSVNHEIWVSSSPIGSDTTGATLINALTGGQTSGNELSSLLDESADRRYVQVRTIAWAPNGYAAWRELQVYSEPPPKGTLIVIQ